MCTIAVLFTGFAITKSGIRIHDGQDLNSSEGTIEIASYSHMVLPEVTDSDEDEVNSNQRLYNNCRIQSLMELARRRE